MKIKTTLDRLEGDKAVLITEEQDEIILMKNLLPKDAKESSIYYISIKDSPIEEGEENTKKAKEILNEILNPASSE